MAEAYGKLTDRPGVCLVTRGPGATQAAVGVHTASQDGTPLILLVGQIPRADVEREAFQELDYRARVRRAGEVGRADRPASSGSPSSSPVRFASRRRVGPARSCSRCPEDVLAEAADVRRRLAVRARAGGARSRRARDAARAARARGAAARRRRRAAVDRRGRRGARRAGARRAGSRSRPRGAAQDYVDNDSALLRRPPRARRSTRRFATACATRTCCSSSARASATSRRAASRRSSRPATGGRSSTSIPIRTSSAASTSRRSASSPPGRASRRARGARAAGRARERAERSRRPGPTTSTTLEGRALPGAVRADAT